MNIRFTAMAFAVAVQAAAAGTYDIGEEFGKDGFWNSDPVLFVGRQAENGFEFTSDQRESAASRRDGGVSCFGIPVYESRVEFGAAGGIERIARISGIEAEKAQAMVDHLSEHTDEVPTNEEWERLDYALASMACETAARRHSGATEEAYTMAGKVFVQTGKDLRPVRQIIVTGGSLIHTKRTGEIASHALYNPAEPMSLRPLKAQVLVDRSYILAAMGLLAEYEPQVALHIMKKELIPDGYQE